MAMEAQNQVADMAARSLNIVVIHVPMVNAAAARHPIHLTSLTVASM